LLAAAGGAGQAAELEDPRLDAERLGAAGIRRVEGRHLTLLTDLPASPELDELPRIFDAALPQWCEYFRVPPASAAAWKPVACVMQDKERFVGAGLYPDDLPPFPHGYSRGERLWLYEQPSGYYRRHLLLHEGTHAFMDRWLGGAGPPWYMEGIAELLATHRWEAGRLTLAVMPQRKEDVPYWGRVKVVKDETAAGRALTLDEIMRYDAQAHQRNEPYAWCWAAAAFFDQHPLTQAAFRELKASVQDRSPRFSRRLTDRLRDHWSQVVEDWQLFVSECDYGYDVARAAVNRRPAAELPAGATTVTIAADRGWQATGIRLEAGRTYLLTASGRYVVVRRRRRDDPLSPRPTAGQAARRSERSGRRSARGDSAHPAAADRASRRDHARADRDAVPQDQRSGERPGGQPGNAGRAD
jgi:hypothetical protein